MQFTPQRLDRVYRAMRREEIDALVITRRQDVQYLTGHLQMFGAIEITFDEYTGLLHKAYTRGCEF